MNKQTEQSNNNGIESSAAMDEEFEMRWNTDDLPEGMKRRKHHHHRHHRHSSSRSGSSSSRHHSSHSKRASINDGLEKTDFEDLLFKNDSVATASERRENDHNKTSSRVISSDGGQHGTSSSAEKQIKSKPSREKAVSSGDRRLETENKGKKEFVTSNKKDTKTGEKKKKEKKVNSGRRKIGLAAICLLLVLTLGGFGFLNGFLNKIGRENSDDLPKADPDKTYEDIDKNDRFGVGDLDLEPIRKDKVKNILLIGQDRRKGDGARMRSDSMIVATIDLTTNDIKLTSLMRDMYVPVPGYGYGMINATYLHGGMALLDETIERNFGITIDGNVEVDFTRFIALMDLIGPLDIELNQEEADFLNRENGWSLKAGNNTMDSDQVLAYCRVRRVGRSDWERTDRQRSVVTKMFNKLRQSDLSTLYRFADEAFPLFKTDLTNREILRYVYTVISKGMHITESKRLPKDGTYTQEIREETLQVLVPDLRANAKLLQEYVYGYSDIQIKKNNEAVEKSKNSKKKSSSLVIEE